MVVIETLLYHYYLEVVAINSERERNMINDNSPNCHAVQSGGM